MDQVGSSLSDPVTVAIVGAGEVGRCHGEAFAQLDSEVQIVGVADIDQDRVRALSGDLDTRGFVDYRDLYELEPDVAVICLPHYLHLEAGLAAAGVGSHVLMEKPLAHTLRDAYQIVRGCQESGVLLATGFVHRYRAEYQRASELIGQGLLGALAMASDSFTFPGGGHVPDWVWKKEVAGGGILMYTGIHSVDRLRWLLESEVDEVFARSVSYSQDREVEDGLVATLVFKNGCIGSLVETQPSYLSEGWGWDTKVYGTCGCLRIRAGEAVELYAEERRDRLVVTGDNYFVSQAADIVSAVREGVRPWITGEDGLRALEVVMAIYHSAKTESPVSVDEFASSHRE